MKQISPHQTIRLAVVTETWPPEINGVANTIHKLITGLLELGHYHMHLVRPVQKHRASIKHPALQETLVPGFSLPVYGELKMGSLCYIRLRKLWQQQRPDVVQIVTEGPLGYSAMKAAKSLNIPVFSDFHTNFDQYSQYYQLGIFFRLAKWYLRHLHNQTALTLVPTRQMINKLETEGYKHLGLLARGVDTNMFTPARRSESLRTSLGLKPDQLLVVMVTRMAKEKNIELAIHTFYAIRKQVPDARFLLVGDGPERKLLQKKHPDCLFAGAKRGENLARYYASGDLFLYPSRSETFGNVITEAMASGLAVVAFDYAATAQHIRSGENGCAIPLHDDEAFIQAGIELATSPEQCRAMGQQAHISAQTLSWNSVVSDLDQTIQKLLEEASDETLAATQYPGNSALSFFQPNESPETR